MNLKNFVFNRSLVGWAVFFFTAIPFAAQAEFQPIVVDGQYDEWDLERDRLLPMHTPGKYLDQLSNVYLRYHSATNTVFILVVQNDNIPRLQNKLTGNKYAVRTDPFIGGGTGTYGRISNFSWVLDGDSRIGWEGSFQLDSSNHNCAAELHLNDPEKKLSLGTRKTVKTVGIEKIVHEVNVIDLEDFLIKCAE